MVQRMVGQPAKIERHAPTKWELFKEKFTLNGFVYAMQSGGHRRPMRRYKTVEKAEKRVSYYAGLITIELQYGGLFGARGMPVGALADIMDALDKKREETYKLESYRNLHKENTEFKERAEAWFTKEYLGPTVHSRFSRCPPVLVTMPLPNASPSKWIGGYYPGTNLISSTCDEKGKPAYGNERRSRNILHEMHHYAAWLGGGGRTRFRDDEGNPVVQLPNPFSPTNIEYDSLHEALTDFLVQELSVGKGLGKTILHPAMIVAIGYIHAIVGAEKLRGAYFTGEFTEVRNKVDDTLGKDAFADIHYTIDSRHDSMVFRPLQERLGPSGATVELASKAALDALSQNPHFKDYLPG